VSIALPPLKWLPSPNFSSRHGIVPDLFVLHETAGSYRSALSWLRNPISDASSTLLLNERADLCAQLVRVHDKPWTQCASFNPRAISLELANLTAKGYHDEHQLRVAARICAWVLHTRDLPLRFARKGIGAGVCRHLDLGALGCGHYQCGPSDQGWWWFLNMVDAELERGGFRKTWMR
jgi:hypothetical protein